LGNTQNLQGITSQISTKENSQQNTAERADERQNNGGIIEGESEAVPLVNIDHNHSYDTIP
jgi:hypothetical protein